MNKRIQAYRARQKRLMKIIYILFMTALVSVMLTVYGWYVIGLKETAVNKAEHEADEYRRIAETAKQEVTELHKQLDIMNGGKEE